MKKSGILNSKLMQGITSLGHYDIVFICDSGFPIPKGMDYVDLAIVENLPTMPQVLTAVLSEAIFSDYYIPDNMEARNPGSYKIVTELLSKQECKKVPFSELRELALTAKLFIRTGDCRPCSNIVLVSASGVPATYTKLDIDCKLTINV
ncbi:MAG: D-ribose pyranase [Oscillospiraceae bacterium]